MTDRSLASPPLRVAIAGAGYFARFHFDGWSRIAGVEIVALADLDGDRRAAAARDFSVAQTFASAAEMVEQVDCDILDIATPPPTHAALVAQGLARGRIVVCQKPFCTSYAQAVATTALAAAAPDRLIIHENFRFEPWYREARKLLDAGTLGEVYQITFRLRPGDGQGPDAYLGRQPYFQTMPRFLVHETAIHFIDTFRYLLGDIDGVSADLRRLNPVIAGEDAALIVFTFASGVRGVFDGNRLADHIADDRRKTMGEMLIEGSRGSLRLDGYGRLFVRAHGSNSEAEHGFDWQDRGYGGDCVYLFLSHVAACARNGSPTETRAHDYLRNLAIEESIYASHEARAYVSINAFEQPGRLPS